MRGNDYMAYKNWLSGVVERINGVHHPKFPGRWFRIELNQTPRKYLNHILWKLKVPVPHSMTKVRHLRQPFLAMETLKITYKTFDVDHVVDFASEQNMHALKLKTAFVNNTETENDQVPENPMAALQFAKSTANSFSHAYPTSRSEIIVEEGEGRATREFELQWWPELYTSDFGKLTPGFFVEKINL
ncbi:hypothetical protein AC249_AIPGENE16777 [Exaiptasia diaphana]|nr:hypothetical protein AC249_AIPGENE16777 [Exaiptasia diaphana]